MRSFFRTLPVGFVLCCASSAVLASPAPRPAARANDMHVCPMVTGLVPHVGGPIAQTPATVVVCGRPAARIGDKAVCAGPPDAIATGSATVLINGKPVARVGDTTAHGGTVTTGCGTVLIGG